MTTIKELENKVFNLKIFNIFLLILVIILFFFGSRLETKLNQLPEWVCWNETVEEDLGLDVLISDDTKNGGKIYVALLNSTEPPKIAEPWNSGYYLEIPYHIIAESYRVSNDTLLFTYEKEVCEWQ